MPVRRQSDSSASSSGRRLRAIHRLVPRRQSPAVRHNRYHFSFSEAGSVRQLAMASLKRFRSRFCPADGGFVGGLRGITAILPVRVVQVVQSPTSPLKSRAIHRHGMVGGSGFLTFAVMMSDFSCEEKSRLGSDA